MVDQAAGLYLEPNDDTTGTRRAPMNALFAAFDSKLDKILGGRSPFIAFSPNYNATVPPVLINVPFSIDSYSAVISRFLSRP